MTLQRQPTATRSASDRLNVESSRLLCDDGRTTSCPTGVRKTQGVRRVGSCAVARAHAASRMRQSSNVTLRKRVEDHAGKLLEPVQLAELRFWEGLLDRNAETLIPL